MSVSNHVSQTEDLALQLIRSALPDLLPISHYEPPWLINPETKRQMHLDYAWPDWKICLEIQGKHHKRPIRRYGQQASSKQWVRDRHKRSLCMSHGWTLFELEIEGLDAAKFRSRFLDPFLDEANRRATTDQQRFAVQRIRSRLYRWQAPKGAARKQGRFARMGIRNQLGRPYRKPGVWHLVKRYLGGW